MQQRRLLLPCSIPPSSSPSRLSSPNPTHHHTHSLKHASGSKFLSNSFSAPDLQCPTNAWMTGWNFQVLEFDVQIQGYQIYAVEKWIVERNRANVLLTVYTGNINDKITVATLSPHSSLEETEAQKEWEKAIHELRRDGARPRETEQGVIMVTSLANFRSDFTVVHIPDGNFLVYRDRLYANINLLRMGCSGRSALTLQDPTDATRDRFIGMYHFRDAQSASPNPSAAVLGMQRQADLQRQFLVRTVLELVKLIQTGLMLFKMFPTRLEELNGLLCDVTVDSVQRWVMEIGEPYFNLEPSERILDPSVVSGLLSLIMATRNKMAALGLGQHLPKDPLLEPLQFLNGVAVFESKLHSSESQNAIHQSGSLGSAKLDVSLATPGSGAEKVKKLTERYLNLEIIWSIEQAYESAHPSRSSTLASGDRTDRERYRDRFQRVIREKIDDLTATASATAGTLGWWPGDSEFNSTSSFTDATCDMELFVKRIGRLNLKEKERDKEGLKDKDGIKEREFGATGLKLLWCGRPEMVARKRAGSLSVWSEPDREKTEENKADGDREEQEGVGLGIGPLPWPNKMQRKLEEWKSREFGRVKTKRLSVDVTRRPRAATLIGYSSHADEQISQPNLPKESHETPSAFSSGQATPISPATSSAALPLGLHPSAETSSTNMSMTLSNGAVIDKSEYNRLLAQFMHSITPGANSTSTDRKTAPLDYFSSSHEFSTLPKHGGKSVDATEKNSSLKNSSSTNNNHLSPSVKSDLLRRRHSAVDVNDVHNFTRLPLSEMQVDVELCAQLLISRRRQARLEATLRALQIILPATRDSNQLIQQLLSDLQSEMQDAENRIQVTADIDQILRRAEDIARDTQALAYEAIGFDIARLWQMAQVPRQRVFTIRQRVFGEPQTKHADSAHARGRFNRAQRMLDRQIQYVDWMGRTESEVEEEADLPEVLPDEEEDDLPELPPSKPAGGWLLTFFTRWGNLFGSSREKEKANGTSKSPLTKVEDLSKAERLIVPEVKVTNADEDDDGSKSGSDVYENAISTPAATGTDEDNPL